MDRDRLLQTFLDLVAVDSPSGHERAIGEVLEARFGELGCETSRDDIGNLVAVFPGRRAGTILLSTHMDTVGSDTGIQPIIGEDGVIRTDGSTILGADDKSGIAGCLELLDPAGGAPGVGVSDHRVRGHGGRGGRPGRFSPPGRRQAERQSRIRDRHRGCDGVDHVLGTDGVDLTVTFTGRKAHAGVEPEKGIDAVRVAAEAVAGMPLGRIDEETVANIGTITGGDARNVVPDRAVLEGMARSHDQEKLDAQLDAMRTACEAAAARHGAGIDFSSEEIYRTYRIEEDAPPYREAAAAIRALGLEVVPRKSGGGTDGNLFNAKGIPCVGLPTGMVDEHATSEHIAIDDMVTACQIMVGIVTGPGSTPSAAT